MEKRKKNVNLQAEVDRLGTGFVDTEHLAVLALTRVAPGARQIPDPVRPLEPSTRCVLMLQKRLHRSVRLSMPTNGVGCFLYAKYKFQ